MANETKITIWLTGLFLLVTLIAFTQSGDGTVEMGRGVSLGKIAPELQFENCINSDKLLTFADLKDKYVLLDFWETW